MMLGAQKPYKNYAKWIVDVLSSLTHFGVGVMHVQIGTSFTAWTGIPGKDATESGFQNDFLKYLSNSANLKFCAS